MSAFLIGAAIAALAFIVILLFFHGLKREGLGWSLSVLIIALVIALFATAPGEESLNFIGGLVAGSCLATFILAMALPIQR